MYYVIISLTVIYCCLSSPFSNGLVWKKKLTNYFDSKYYKNNKNKINKNTDFLLNDVIRELNLKVYWAEPAIVKQGSEVDLFDITYNIRF